MLDDISTETIVLGTHLYVGIMDECAALIHKYLYFTALLKTDRKSFSQTKLKGIALIC